MKLVVFDCDGTLVDSQHVIVKAMDGAFAAHGLDAVPREAVLSVVGLSLDHAIARLQPDAEPGDVKRLAASYKAAFAGLRTGQEEIEPLYAGIRETLEALAADASVVLGIATGKSRRGVATILEREGLAAYFATVQTADTHPSKPNPSMLLGAMAETGVAPAETIMIGDTTFDMEMACRAGVTAIGVGWGYHDATSLIEAGAETVVHPGDLLTSVVRDALFKRGPRS